MGKYEVGQRWTYKTRPQDAGSTLLIGRIDPRPVPIIHVQIYGVASPLRSERVLIAHMPFSEAAIERSVLERVESGVAVERDFADGMASWARDQGGVFDLAVADAIDAVMSVAPAANDDSFDELVTRMRAARSESLVRELYQRLFSLEQWFFLADPGHPRQPVQWTFPAGLNPKPALLAFTSRERAVVAAVSLGLYPERSDAAVMAAPIRFAVHWIAGPLSANEWLCFNLTRENFPLYVRDAIPLFRQFRQV